MLSRATQDGLVTLENPDKMLSTGEGNGKPLQNSCLENPRKGMKRQKDRTLKDEFPRCPICYCRRLIIFFAIQSTKTRPGAGCGSDHELLIVKFRLKLKKVGKTTRSFRYD